MSDQCPYCQAKLIKYWHRLNPVLVHSLVKLYAAVVRKGENQIHSRKEISDMSIIEYNNFQKLRYFGLIAHSGPSGYWLITHRGAEFLKGNIRIPRRVQTFRNHIESHDDELVSVSEVIKENISIDTKKDYLFTSEQKSIETPVYFDQKGQGYLFA